MELKKEFVKNCRKIGVLQEFLCQAIDQIDERDITIVVLNNKNETLLSCIISLIIGGTCIIRGVQCHLKASKQEMECSYNPLQGCMVKVDGKWIDYNRLRVME